MSYLFIIRDPTGHGDNIALGCHCWTPLGAGLGSLLCHIHLFGEQSVDAVEIFKVVRFSEVGFAQPLNFGRGENKRIFQQRIRFIRENSVETF